MRYAWQIAKQTWESQNPGKSFETLLGRYVAEGGVVWSEPSSFLLGCRVSVEHDGSLRHDPEQGDTWLVHLVATTSPALEDPKQVLRQFMRLAPHPLEWICWHRRKSKRLHLHPWNRCAAWAGLEPARTLTHHEYIR